MAILFEERVSATGANVSSLTLPSISGGTNQLYMLAVTTKKSGSTITTASGGSLTWVERKEQHAGRDQTRAAVFSAYGSPGSFAVTVNFSGSVEGAAAVLCRYSGAADIFDDPAGSNTNGRNGSNSGGSDNDRPTHTITPAQAGSLVFVATATRNKTITANDADYTERGTVMGSSGGGAARIYAHDRISAPASLDTIALTISDDQDWAMAAVAVRSSVTTGRTVAAPAAAATAAVVAPTLAHTGNITLNAPAAAATAAGLVATAEVFRSIGGAASASYPSIRVEIAFTPDPNSGGTPVWTDVTKYVRGLSIRRGRQDELGLVEAGTMTLLLDNADRRFEPNFAAGAYYPSVEVLRPVRVRAQWSGTSYGVFRGFVQHWPQSYPLVGKDAISVVPCVDGFGILNLARLKRPKYAGMVGSDAPAGYWRLGEGSGTTAADSSPNANHGTYSGNPTLGSAGAIMEDTDDAVTLGATQYVSVADANSLDLGNTFTLEAWVYADLTAPATAYILSKGTNAPELYLHYPAGVSGARLVLAVRGVGVVAASGYTIPLKTWTHVVATKSGATSKVYIDGTDQSAIVTDRTAASTATALTIGNSSARVSADQFVGRLDEVAVYPTALSATRVAAHYAAGSQTYAAEQSGVRVGLVLDDAEWPAADRSIQTGGSELERSGSILDQTALGHLQEVCVVTENGVVFCDRSGSVVFQDRYHRLFNETAARGTLGDGAGELPYTDCVIAYDDTQLWNEARITPKTGTAQTSRDQESVEKFWPRTLSRSTHSAEAEAFDAATYLIQRYGAPELRVREIAFAGAANTSLWPHLLGAEISHRYTFKRRPPGGGAAISIDVHVEGVSHEITPGGWLTRWNVSNAAATEQWWILGHSVNGVLGSTTRLGY